MSTLGPAAIAPAVSAADAKSAIPSGPGPVRREVARQFETLLITDLLRRANVMQGLHGSSPSQAAMFADLVIQQFSEQLAKAHQGALGVAAMLDASDPGGRDAR